jgi:hypothetical protein
MVRRAVFMVTVCSVLLLCGCIPMSVYPFYTEKDLVFNADLLGMWISSDDESHYLFEQADSTAYTMTYREGDKESKYDAHLFKLGNVLFLDVYPRDESITADDMLLEHLVRVHSCYRVRQITPTPVFCTFDYGWLKDELAKDPKAPAHVVFDDQLDSDAAVADSQGVEEGVSLNWGRVILTAPTADVQAFMLKHLETEGAFSDSEEMHRLPKR